MIFMEAREVLTAPAPPYKIDKDSSGNVFYTFDTSEGEQVVQFFKSEARINEYVRYNDDLAERIKPFVTADENNRIYSYELRFGPVDTERNTDFLVDTTTYSLTHKGNPTEVLIGVRGAVEDFIKTSNHDFSVMYFTADGRGRVKTYNLLTKILADKMEVKYFITPDPSISSTYSVYYIFFKDVVHTKKWHYGMKNLHLQNDLNFIINRTKGYYSSFMVEIEFFICDDSGQTIYSPTPRTISYLSITPVGKQINLVPETEFLHFSKEFNYRNGRGVVIEFISERDFEPDSYRSFASSNVYTIGYAYTNALDLWTDENKDLKDEVSFSNNDSSDRFINKIKRLFIDVVENLNDFTLDFIIIKNANSIDPLLHQLIYPIFPYSPAEDEYIKIVDPRDSDFYYIAIYRPGYDIENKEMERNADPDSWTSLPSQRKRDRQLNLPFGF
jgi:hypothetical protein